MTPSQWLARNLADVIVAVAQANATLSAQSQPTLAGQSQEVTPDA
jgi:hypothetical protein